MMSLKFLTLPCLALAAALLLTESGYAQTSGRTSGGTTGRTTGNTGGGATGGAAGGGAGSGMTAGAGGQVVSGQTQNVQQSATFLGAGGSGAFVGAGGGGQQTQSRNTGRQFQVQNQNTGRQQFQQFNSSTLQLPRPQLVIAFDVPELSSQAMQASLVNTFQGVPTTIPGEGRFPGVTPTFTDGGQVRLTGSVPDQRTRQLAEMLVRLEPGVRSVQNDLVVVPASTAP